MPFNYNKSIPAADNNPSVDQPNMQENTDSIDSIINVDHFTFGSGPDGEHKQVTLPLNLGTVPTVIGPLGLLYTALDAASAAQLIFKNKTTTFQMTTSVTIGNDNNGKNVYTIVTPWGFIFKFGNTSIGPTGLVSILLSDPFPVILLGVTATPTDQAVTIRSRTFAPNGFDLAKTAAAGTTSTSWFAWGQ